MLQEYRSGDLKGCERESNDYNGRGTQVLASMPTQFFHPLRHLGCETHKVVALSIYMLWLYAHPLYAVCRLSFTDQLFSGFLNKCYVCRLPLCVVNVLLPVKVYMFSKPWPMVVPFVISSPMSINSCLDL